MSGGCRLIAFVCRCSLPAFLFRDTWCSEMADAPNAATSPPQGSATSDPAGNPRPKSGALLPSSDIIAIQFSFAVADHLGFRKAAIALGVQESILSRRIHALEERLHVSLFERQPRGVRLTIAGKRFLNQARAALNEINYAVANARAAGRGEQGLLRIGLIVPLTNGFLPELVRRYRTGHPQVTIEMREGSGVNHLAMIRERHLDVAFMIGAAESSGCETALLWSEPVYVALPEGHPLAAQTEVAWQDLSKEKFIVSRSDCGAEVQEHLVRHATDLGHGPEMETVPVSRLTLLNMVGLGFGPTLVSESATSTVAGVVFRRVVNPSDVVSFSAAWSPENDNPASRQFVSLAHVIAGRVRKGASDWTGREP